MKRWERSAQIATLMVTLPGLAGAAFDYKIQGARAAAMGRSVFASNGEASAVFGHPAGLASLSSPELAFTYARPFVGVDGLDIKSGSLAAAMPWAGGTLGLGAHSVDTPGLSSEQTVSLSYGRQLGSKASAGVSASYLRHGFTPNSVEALDPVFQKGQSASAVSLDASMSFQAFPFTSFNIAASRLNRPDMGLATQERLDRRVEAGLLFALDSLGLNTSSGLSMGGSGDLLPVLGLEKKVAGERLALRAGATPDEWTAGFGLAFGNLRVDYASGFQRALRGEELGAHRITLAYKIGKEN